MAGRSFPMNSSTGSSQAVGGNAPGPASQVSAQQQQVPSAGTAPQQLGAGGGGGGGGAQGVTQPGASPVGQLLAQAFDAIVTNGFAQEDLQTTMDFFQTLQSTVEQSQPAGAQQGAPPTGPAGPSV